MTSEQIKVVKQQAPVAFAQIKAEYDCNDEEAALILSDTIDVNAVLAGDENVQA